MSPRGASRPHSIVRGRTWSLHRPAAALLVLCACASFILVWRPSFTRSSSGLLTSLSGHSYHPKLCNSPGDLSSRGDSSSSSHPACGELHDPQLAEEVVQLPPSLLLISDDAQVRNLQQLLHAAAQQHWPLPLARRVVSLLLQGAVPPVHTSSTGTSNTQQQPTQTLPLSAAESGHTAGWRFATQAAAVLGSRSGNNLVPCSFDPSLPTEFHTRFLFSAPWPAQAASDTSSSSSATALANAVLQLLSTVALLPPGAAYISVSVPPDAASGSLFWLDLLQLLAAPLGVPVHTVQQAAGNTTAADMTGLPQLPSHSTSHIARAALSAFFPSWQGPPTPAAAAAAAAQGSQQESGQLHQGRRLHQRNQDQQQQLGGEGTSNSPDPSSSSGSIKHGSCPAGAPAPSCYEPEYVVMFEPAAFFCSGDLLRLMEYPEDLVCGLHLDEFRPLQLRHKQHRHRHRHRHRAAARKLQQAAAAAAAGGSSALHEGPMAAAVAAAGQAIIKPEVPPEFEMHSLRAAYDATREITGDMLSAHAPYFSHSPSQELARAGLPVPVYCCWGGVAKLRAAPLAAGLRFRAGEEGECRPPDPMSLLCDDLWRTGNSHILLDPGVRTSSQLRTKSLFEHPRFPFFYYTQNWETTAWFDIHPQLPLQYWNKTAAPSNTQSSSSSSSSNSTLSGDGEGSDPTDDVSSQAAGWLAKDWEPGEQQMCCEGQQWSGAGRPNHPTDCRRVKALAGKNFTSGFLQRCAATHRQGNGLGAECG